MIEKAKGCTVGDPFDPEAQQGPQVLFTANDVIPNCCYGWIALLFQVDVPRRLIRNNTRRYCLASSVGNKKVLH